MTARECLRHRWLASYRKTSTCKSSPRAEVVATPDPSRRVGCSSCPPSTNQKNLRKYLSKSREALFEKVISRSKDLPQENLRKSTLMSRTRRMCESQMSLVSKSRERLISDQQSMMTPGLHRSREKLYGLRSLSKSHEVLNLYKTVGALKSDIKVPESSPLRGILKTLTRATTISTMTDDKENNCHEDAETNVKKVEIGNVQESDKESKSLQSKANSDESVDVDVPVPLEVQPLQSVLKFICKNSINNEPKNNSLTHEEFNKENVSVHRRDEKELENSNENSKEENSVFVGKRDKHRPPPLLTKQLSLIQSDDDPHSPDINHDSLSLTEGTSTSGSEISDEDAGSLERITSDLYSEEDEPRYTVAQLISAYNLHQEIVTKCSLEVTMNAGQLEEKIPPLIEKTPNKKFPTGPNALRLFIPNIDIALRSVKRIARKKPTMRPAPKTVDEIKEESTNVDIAGTQSPATKVLIEDTAENKTDVSNKAIDSKCPNKTTKTPLDVEKPHSTKDPKYKLEKSESKEKCHISGETTTKSFVRSSSISSEASFKSSGASSNVTTSMEELTSNERRPRSNRSSGIASSEGEQPEAWTNKTSSSSHSSSSRAPVDRLSHATPRPNRKSFCSPRAPTIHTDSKTRRKSSPIMKPFY